MPTELEILEEIKNSFELIKSERSSPSKEKKILRKIRKLKSPKSEELRINAAQWVVIYNMSEFTNSENEKQIESLLKNANNDLKHALKLLEKPFTNINLVTHSILITADIAQKLSDFVKLGESYNQILRRSSMNPQLSFVALSISPSMADWRLFYRICLLMEKDYNNLALKSGSPEKSKIPKMSEALHQMAQAGSPDLGVIYNLVKEFDLQRIKTPKPEALFEHTVTVKRADISILKIVAENEERKKEIREQFDKEKDTEFNLETLSLSVNGGLVLFPGLSKEVPMMLVGPYFDAEKIVVEGYVDLQLQETDENGNPKADFSPEAINAELMKHMPPEILAAIESGQISPEMVMEAMAQFSNPAVAAGGASGSSPNNPLLASSTGGADNGALRESFAKMARKFDEVGPEMMRTCGISLIRQQERIELKRSEKGYSGTYFVRNYSPVDRSDETSIMLAIELECEPLKPPPSCIGDVEEEIQSGVDNLSLE